MKVNDWLEVYLESDLSPLSVDDHITDDSKEEILETCTDKQICDDGVIYYNDGPMCAYYHLNEEPEDCFHFVDILDTEEDFDDEDIEEDYFEFEEDF